MFLLNQAPFNGQSCQTQKGLELVTSCSSGYKKVQKNAYNSYILADQAWWYI